MQGISNKGSVVGYGYFSSRQTGIPGGFERSANGRFGQPIVIPGPIMTTPHGVNASSIVCSTFFIDADHGFFFDGSTDTQFDVAGAVLTNEQGISDTGDFVGYSFSDPEVITPFVYRRSVDHLHYPGESAWSNRRR